MHSGCQPKLEHLQWYYPAGRGGDMSGRMIEFRVNDRSARGYGAIPSSGNGPGVVVIHEWWGLVDHIKAVVDRFASEGFVAMAPDLFHGEATRLRDRAGSLMMMMSIDEAERDLAGAIFSVLDNPATSSRKIGVIGFSMGGALALQAATKSPAVGGCVVFYGLHPNVHPNLARLEAPVLGLYAERDRTISPEYVRNLEQKMRQLGKRIDIHVYPADHGFFNDTRKETFDDDAAADAWQRTLDFLRRHLN
jgi:carboxymethylenebutenolidase